MSIWIEDGLKHITPKGIDFPEGFDVLKMLRGMVGDKRVLEIGCGRGRLAPAFDPDKYLGLDINNEAIGKAKADNPEHRFGMMGGGAFDVTLLYTVALHVEDFSTIQIETDRVIIAEIMNPDLAKPEGIPPSFNRSEQQYINLMSERGYSAVSVAYQPYTYYPGQNITFLEFSR